MEEKKKYGIGKLFIKTILGLSICLMAWVGNTKLVQAYEESNSFLGVGGTYMVRYGKLQTTTVKGEKGTATYDEATNTLTLNNFKDTRGENIGIQNMSGLKIILKGISELNSDFTGIYAAQKGGLTICGGGTLNIVSGTKEKYGLAIETEGNLYIQDCILNIFSSSSPLSSNKGIVIKNSTVRLKRTGVNELNDPSTTNGLYNRKYRFAGLNAESLTMTSSVLDVTGINYAIGVDNKPILDSDAVITDQNGTKLNLIKFKWPDLYERYPDSPIFEYVYSTSTQDMIYSFDEAPNHVIIKSQPVIPSKPEPPVPPSKPETPVIPGKPETPNTPEKPAKPTPAKPTPAKPTPQTKPATPDIGKVNGTYKVGNFYYTGKLASGKVSCIRVANKKTTSVTIPSTVKIKGYTCKVTFIGKKTFKNCTSLKTVRIGNNVTSIGAEAFYNCKRLKSLSIGKNITTISERAFYQCSSLSKVTLPSKTKTIKKGAFAHCTSLKTVKIGNGVTSIGEAAFYNCKKLTALSLGKNVSTISERAFYKCSSLKKVTFQTKLKYIRKDAFANCSRLKTITFEGKGLKSVSSGAFRNTANKAKITVPKSKYSSYKKLLYKKGLKQAIYQKR